MRDMGSSATPKPELTVELGDDYVATLEFSRPPSNYFSPGLIRQIADACEELAADARCRAIVLCSAGRVFCAGADFSDEHAIGAPDGSHLYEFAGRLLEQPLRAGGSLSPGPASPSAIARRMAPATCSCNGTRLE